MAENQFAFFIFNIVRLLLFSESVAAITCECDFYVGAKCAILVEQSDFNWTTAENNCQSNYNGHLMSIENAEEDNDIAGKGS